MLRSKLLVIALLTLLSSISIAQNQERPAWATIAGSWDAVITNASKIDVPFGLSIIQDRSFPGRFHAMILNGSERIPFTSVVLEENEVKMRLEQYDGTLSVHSEGVELRGEWVRQTAKGVMHYAFRATRSARVGSKPTAWKADSLAGQWTLTFEGSSSTDKIAPAEFKQAQAVMTEEGVVAEVEGTIAPVSGDYGLLAGKIRQVEGKPATIELSRFDGIHIVLVTGEFQPDGSLSGRLNKQEFTGVRKDATAKVSESPALEVDPESVTKLKVADEQFRFRGIDPKTGKAVTQDDGRFKGKPYIVDIFGTWCPNCHDEAPLLADLYKRYRAQGLEIVALAYEYVDDSTRNARLLDVYRKKYSIEFPMLLAGTTDEGQIAKTLPQLVGFGAYPTTIFVGRDGKVQKIHAGFAGPATGERFTETKKRFEESVKALVAK